MLNMDYRKKLDSLKVIDGQNMAEVIKRTPDQIEYALKDTNMPKIKNKLFDKAILIGMGGSALPVEVLHDAFEEDLCKPLLVSRQYDLPYEIDDKTLIIGSSYSGSTEETVMAIEDVSIKFPNLTVVVITAKKESALAKYATKRSFPIIRIPSEREPKNFQPRCATGYFVTYLSRLLADVGILKSPEPELERLVHFLGGLSEIREQAEEMAFWIGDRIPLFYTDAKYERSIARIAKIKHNENAKRPAFYNSLPEANHNEMIGLTGKFGKFACIYLADPKSNPKIHKRFKIMKKAFHEREYDHVIFNKWEIPGETNLEKIFASLMFSDWCSYTLALLNGHDPTPVEFVEYFKKALEASE